MHNQQNQTNHDEPNLCELKSSNSKFESEGDFLSTLFDL